MVGLNPTDFRDYVVVPTLKYLDPEIPYSDGAVEQVLGTALAESHLCRLVQVGGGPALGVYQIEPATEQDCWTNWITFQTGLEALMRPFLPSPAKALVTDLGYATAICRIVYRRSPLPIPAAGDRPAQGETWVKAYNKGGAATVEKYIQAWQEAGL